MILSEIACRQQGLRGRHAVAAYPRNREALMKLIRLTRMGGGVTVLTIPFPFGGVRQYAPPNERGFPSSLTL
jgi:hypothetical protein